MELVESLSAIARKKTVTPSQLTLAWLMAQGNDIFPILGSTKIHRLEENLMAAKIQLNTEEEKEIRQAFELAEVAGDRYPRIMAKALFADTAIGELSSSTHHALCSTVEQDCRIEL